MRLKIDASGPLSAIKGQDPAILRAAVQLQLARAHGLPDFAIPAMFATSGDASIAAIASRLAGKPGRAGADLSFDVRERPSKQGVASPALYHALCVLYASREFGWADIDEADAARSLECDDPVAEAVDSWAEDFDIAAVDDWTRRSLESVSPVRAA